VSLRLGLIALLGSALISAPAANALELVVSVPEQKMYLFDDAGEKVTSYRVSTSAHGLGDGRGTYATPLGKLEVAAKIGAGAPLGMVFKGGRPTGEICEVNAKGRDPIVTRILHLRGLETHNARAFARGIYIHGTPDERRIGEPVSYGCIRMKSADIVDLFERVNVGTPIEITQLRVGGMFGGVARRPSRVEPVASGPVQSPAPVLTPAPTKTVAATTSVPKNGYANSPIVALSAKRPESPREAKAARAEGSQVRLLETSGLTINFGGGFEDADRPR
jgi:hypothetical protein